MIVTKHILLPIVTLVSCGLLTNQAIAQDGEARGRAALTWLQEFECPQLGVPLHINGLETAEQVERLQNDNLNYVRSRREAVNLALRARRQVEREISQSNKRKGKKLQKAFDELDTKINNLGGDVAHVLSQWVMAGYVSISKTEPNTNPLTATSHPLTPFIQKGEVLRSEATPFGSGLLVIGDRWYHCLSEANAALLQIYEPEIMADVEAANSAAALDGVLRKLQVPGLDNNSPILAQIRSIQLAMANEERREQERQRATRDAEARKILVAQAKREQAIAARYVNFLNANQINDAIKLLTGDVILRTQGSATVQGRQIVAQRMRSAASKGQQVKIGSPRVNGNNIIYVDISGGGRSGRMLFGFRDGLISNIRIVQR